MTQTQTKIEFRDTEGLTVQDDAKKMIVTGVAVQFGVPSCIFEDSDGTKYYEVIQAGAFDDVDFSDTCLRYNHDDNVPVLASARNGSLAVTVDDKQLALTAEIANTTTGKDIYELVRTQAVGGLSIGFVVAPQGDSYVGNTRVISKIKELREVSIVDHPAYSGTSIEAVRSIERARKQREDKRKKLICRTYF